MKSPHIKHVKRTVAKGKAYYYFRTGKADEHGREVLMPLPDLEDPAFWASYGSYKAGRSRRENVATELTISDLIDLWQKSPRWLKPKAEKGYADGTKRLYGFGLAYLRSQLPTAPAGLLERKDVALLVDSRADTPGAANALLRTIGAMYRWARERGHVTNDPTKDIRELEVGEHQPWTDHILEAALAAEDDRVRLGVHLLYYTAQRIEDVVRMQARHIRDGVLYITPVKTGRELEIPVHEALADELARHGRDLGFIIPGPRRGRPISQDALRTSLQKWVAKRFGAEVVPHGLRKNAVNALLEAGCSAAEVASISGQSLQMIEHYARARSQKRLGRSAVRKWQNRT